MYDLVSNVAHCHLQFVCSLATSLRSRPLWEEGNQPSPLTGRKVGHFSHVPPCRLRYGLRLGGKLGPSRDAADQTWNLLRVARTGLQQPEHQDSWVLLPLPSVSKSSLWSTTHLAPLSAGRLGALLVFAPGRLWLPTSASPAPTPSPGLSRAAPTPNKQTMPRGPQQGSRERIELAQLTFWRQACRSVTKQAEDGRLGHEVRAQPVALKASQPSHARALGCSSCPLVPGWRLCCSLAGSAHACLH